MGYSITVSKPNALYMYLYALFIYALHILALLPQTTIT